MLAVSHADNWGRGSDIAEIKANIGENNVEELALITAEDSLKINSFFCCLVGACPSHTLPSPLNTNPSKLVITYCSGDPVTVVY